MPVILWLIKYIMSWRDSSRYLSSSLIICLLCVYISWSVYNMQTAGKGYLTNTSIAPALTLSIVHNTGTCMKSVLREPAGQVVKQTGGALPLLIDGLISILLYLSISHFANISPWVPKPLFKLDKCHPDRLILVQR